MGVASHTPGKTGKHDDFLRPFAGDIPQSQ